MSESLLSFSEVLLFGRKVEDLRVGFPVPTSATTVDVTTTRHVHGGLTGHKVVDGTLVTDGTNVLVRHHGATGNGIYTVGAADANWTKSSTPIPKNNTVFVDAGEKFAKSLWKQVLDPGSPPKQQFKHVSGPGRGLGQNNQLDDQLGEDSCFARIYGFSYEGTYYELPNPTLFLVHGDGESATDGNAPTGQGARAPLDPSRSGVAAADYQIANDIRVWTYDKADYTIRMDVASGMFEQVLLDLFFEVDLPMMAGAKVSGAKVSGAKVAGAKVAGAKVSGAKVAGAKVSGAKVGGFGD